MQHVGCSNASLDFIHMCVKLNSSSNSCQEKRTYKKTIKLNCCNQLTALCAAQGVNRCVARATVFVHASSLFAEQHSSRCKRRYFAQQCLPAGNVPVHANQWLTRVGILPAHLGRTSRAACSVSLSDKHIKCEKN